MRGMLRRLALLAACLALAVPAAASARPADFTVMTFNIASAVETDNDLGPIAAAIGHVHPTVVGLQEVDRSWSRSDSLDQPADLAARLRMRWSFDANLDCTSQDLDQDGFCQYGTAILSRYALRASATRQYRLPQLAGDEPRGLAQVGTTISGHRLTVFNTHLSALAAGRRRQVRYILGVLRSIRGPFILMGDFNARPGATEIRWVRARLTDAALVGHVTRPTVGSTRIDYVFASRGIRVLSATVPLASARRVSDHRPLIARLRIGG
jgi:endonuclease/exonuclease/phosphatase family metal-dependent hydrolase